jgi:hypothetical protein
VCLDDGPDLPGFPLPAGPGIGLTETALQIQHELSLGNKWFGSRRQQEVTGVPFRPALILTN